MLNYKLPQTNLHIQIIRSHQIMVHEVGRFSLIEEQNRKQQISIYFLWKEVIFGHGTMPKLNLYTLTKQCSVYQKHRQKEAVTVSRREGKGYSLLLLSQKKEFKTKKWEGQTIVISELRSGSGRQGVAGSGSSHKPNIG